MMDNPQYILIAAASVNTLNINVNKHLEKGFVLHGSPFGGTNSGGYCQAVVIPITKSAAKAYAETFPTVG